MTASRRSKSSARTALLNGSIIAIAAVALSGCYPYRLSGIDLVPTDQRLAASGYRLESGPPLADVGRRLGLSVIEEDLQAPFGRVALTRFEHPEPRPLIVFCGGNMFRREIRGPKIVELLSPYGDVWIFDYPGYGDTAGAGRPDEFDALGAVIATRVDRAFTEGRPGGLTFWGHSLGGAVCGDLAGRSATPSDIVLVATFQSFDQVVRAGATARAGPLGVLVRPVLDEDLPTFDIARSLHGYGGTAVVVAARDDATVPYLASGRLEQALRRQGVATRLIAIPTGDHARIHETPGLIAQVREALASAGKARKAHPSGF